MIIESLTAHNTTSTDTNTNEAESLNSPLILDCLREKFIAITGQPEGQVPLESSSLIKGGTWTHDKPLQT